MKQRQYHSISCAAVIPPLCMHPQKNQMESKAKECISMLNLVHA